jgi:CheY-like chemotaxis protein
MVENKRPGRRQTGFGEIRHFMTTQGTILLISDDAGSIMDMRKAFAEAEVLQPLQTSNSCKDAVAFLSGDGIYANRTSFPPPILVLLDLKMGGDHGFEFLRWLYQRPGLRKQLTVVVLGSTQAGEETQLAYGMGAQSYLVKPADYKQLLTMVHRIKDYWIELNVLPGDSP